MYLPIVLHIPDYHPRNPVLFFHFCYFQLIFQMKLNFLLSLVLLHIFLIVFHYMLLDLLYLILYNLFLCCYLHS